MISNIEKVIHCYYSISYFNPKIKITFIATFIDYNSYVYILKVISFAFKQCV